MSYRYQNGDRPLDGFTIQYALGRGGFGEVYFAVSDSGREVALKAVQNYEEVELRGISHCMNLKSPHLVMIFDVKRAADGLPWVIMEYVSGPSLRDILDEAPEGLDTEQVRFFMRELCKGLSYLHEAGVVHRDLKPHNVFFEDGIVKIGDYSLSKVITNSHRSGNTMTVGSVHYMAPEISMGRYDKTVDIYALGCMLFEMITGKPPHVGESMGEVLMKHLSQEPDLENLPEPFASAVAKAMQRDPSERFVTSHEFASAIQEANTPSVMDTFHPATLSMAGERARASREQKATVQRSENRPSIPPGMPPIPPAGVAVEDSPAAERLSGSTAPTMRGDTGNLPDAQPIPSGFQRRKASRSVGVLQTIGLRFIPTGRTSSAPDHLTMRWRFLLLATVAILGTIICPVPHGASFSSFVLRAWMTVVAGGIGAILSRSDAIVKRGLFWTQLARCCFALTGLAAAASLADSRFSHGPDSGLATVFAFFAAFCIPDWRCLISPDRPQRFVVPATLFIGACAGMASLFICHRMDIATAHGSTAMLFALAMQVAAPFRGPSPEGEQYFEAPRDVPHRKHPVDKTAIFLEAIFLACAITVVGFLMNGDMGSVGISIPFGIAGLYSLYLRLLRRRQPDGTVQSGHTTVLLDLLTGTSAAAFVGCLIQGHPDTLPGMVIFGSMAVLFGHLRYVKKQRLQEHPFSRFKIDKISVMVELVGLLAIGWAMTLFPWIGFGAEYFMGTLIAAAIATIAFRIRFSRDLYQATSVQETIS